MIILQTMSPESPEVQRLHSQLQDEYRVLYGEPDQNPAGGLENARYPFGSVLVAFEVSDPSHGELLPEGGSVAEAIGMVGVTWRGQRVAEMHRMYVAPTHRGHGISKKLLTSIEAVARAINVRRIELETGTVQTTAQSLYRAAGYTDTEPFGFYAGQPTSVFLGKDL